MKRKLKLSEKEIKCTVMNENLVISIDESKHAKHSQHSVPRS